jgi:hypothetical protein
MLFDGRDESGRRFSKKPSLVDRPRFHERLANGTMDEAAEIERQYAAVSLRAIHRHQIKQHALARRASSI